MDFPLRSAWLATRDTAIATTLAILLSLPFLFAATFSHLASVFDPATLPTCTAWELTAESSDAPRAEQALALARETFEPSEATFELIEKEGAIWLNGCFPDALSSAVLSPLLEEQGFFAGRLSIEWPEMRERVFPRLLEAVDASWLPIALATPLGFALTALFFIRRRRLATTSRSGSATRDLSLGLLAGVAAFAAVTLAETALAALGMRQEEQAWITSLVEQGGTALWALAVFAVLLAPLGEELFFRRYLFEFLDRSAGRAWAFGLSTGLFALIHLNPAGLISYGLYGLLLAAVYDRTRSLLAAYATHGLANALSVAQLALWT